MQTHDPLGFTSGLSARLASRARHVCLFVGAGASRSCGLPDLAELQEKIVQRLDGNDGSVVASMLESRNLEQVLSRLRRVSAVLDVGEELGGLSSDGAKRVDASICKEIMEQLQCPEYDLGPLRHLAAWLGRANYHQPIEVFTLNYDLLLETALDELKIPYFDGFIGNTRARFHEALVEAQPKVDIDFVPAFFVRLWKLHGSIDWAWTESGEAVRLGRAVPEGEMAAIYPSDTKYVDSRRVPFLVLQDRLRRSLRQPETLMLVTGYSFSDDHINELLFDAAMRRERSEIVAFCFSAIPDALAERALMTPNLQAIAPKEAILGGVRAAWEPPEQGSFHLWSDGSLNLTDFAEMARYLSRNAPTTGSKTSGSGQPIEADDLLK